MHAQSIDLYALAGCRAAGRCTRLRGPSRKRSKAHPGKGSVAQRCWSRARLEKYGAARVDVSDGTGTPAFRRKSQQAARQKLKWEKKKKEAFLKYKTSRLDLNSGTRLKRKNENVRISRRQPNLASMLLRFFGKTRRRVEEETPKGRRATQK